MKQWLTPILGATALIVLISGCTNKELYNATKNNRESFCRTLPPQDAEECKQSLNKKSYEEYERQRKQIISSKGTK